MKPYFKRAGALCAVILAAAPLCLRAQDGSDINKAFPIYFGQTVNDTGDNATRPYAAYSINLAKGQTVTVQAKVPPGATSHRWGVAILRPSTVSVATFQNADCLAWWGNCLGNYDDPAQTFTYQVATAGTYYIAIKFYSGGVNYNLTVNAVGTPIGVPNPASSGCVNGFVDYITYSLQFIAANLPDEVSINGTKMCATCSIKAPIYSQIVDKLETALRTGLSTQVCYAADGNIFQVSLVSP